MTRFQFPVRNLPMPIQEFATEMEHIVDRMFPRAGTPESRTNDCQLAYAPAMDISETETQYVIALDLPGVKSEDVKLEIHEDRLTISGTRAAIERTEGTQFHREERSFGQFLRTLVLPKSVDTENIGANYQDGVLHVVVPKQPKAQPRTIEIKSLSV